MSDRPTPETDAEIYPMNGVDIVWPEFSRQLERERDEAREQNTKLCDIAERIIQYVAFSVKEKLRAELDQLKGARNE